jgi:hypothetical protein
MLYMYLFCAFVTVNKFMTRCAVCITQIELVMFKRNQNMYMCAEATNFEHKCLLFKDISHVCHYVTRASLLRILSFSLCHSPISFSKGSLECC